MMPRFAHSLLVMLMLSSVVPQVWASQSSENFRHHQAQAYRYQSSLFYWWPAEWCGVLAQAVPVQFCVQSVLGPLTTQLTPADLQVITPQGSAQPFAVVRGGITLAPQARLQTGDMLRCAFPAQQVQAQRVAVLLVLYGRAAGEDESIDSPAALDLTAAPLTDQTTDTAHGMLDTTGPVDLSAPAALIQMNVIYSERWNLWYEFAGWEGEGFAAAPVNPLYMSSLPGSNSTLFNMDDVPRFPLYYARYIKVTGDESVRPRLRQGLEAILTYLRPDGTMPYLIAPWNGRHTEGPHMFDTYHSLRALAEGMPLFEDDPVFADRLAEAYRRLRGFVMTHLDGDGLFMGRASCNGALIDAFYEHWKNAKDPQAMEDLKVLAEPLLTSAARAQRDDYGEYLPWAPLGMTLAYAATGEQRYLDEANAWLDDPILPSLLRDRRYYYPLPDFKASAAGQPWGCNPLQVWYHTDWLMTLYKVTGQARYFDLAAWVMNDVYDTARYASTPQWHIIDTGNPATEYWGAASAEDALRMMAKVLWQIQYPDLYARSRTQTQPPAGLEQIVPSGPEHHTIPPQTRTTHD